jgi:hypothetical protein
VPAKRQGQQARSSIWRMVREHGSAGLQTRPNNTSGFDISNCNASKARAALSRKSGLQGVCFPREDVGRSVT